MSSPLTDKINALTAYANGVTGESDTTLSDAVATLADGYGQGGGYAGIEVKTDANGKITDYIFHGYTEIPPFALNYTGYIRNGANDGYPAISFADKPTSLAARAISLAYAFLDVSGLSELEKVAGEYALVFPYGTVLDYSDVVFNLPKFKGWVDSTYHAVNCFRAESTKAPKTYILPVCEIIPQFAWYGSRVTGLSITIGSVGHAVTRCRERPLGATSNASGTVTIYTDGSHLDTIKASVQQGAGSNLTFIYKASEATTYNGVSYSAGDTITV